jgi:hypothetical protein
MEQLKKAIGDPPLLVVCSDACKGLENAMKNVFSNAEQRECFYHFVRNFQKRFRGFGQIYPATRAHREEIFYDNLAKMVSESAQALQWLRTNHKLLGEGTSSQTEATSPVRMPITTAPKKMTPKRKLLIG